MLTSLGIDLSTKATGVVLLRESVLVPSLLLEQEITPKETGLNGAKSICAEVMTVINQHKPDKIVLEGYSLNLKNSSSVIPLVTVGALLRFFLQLDGYGWYDPRASEVKKFVTGKGNSPKDVVMMHVLKRWAHESKTNNTADAYVCAAMGLAQSNRLANVTKDMRAIAGQMTLMKN